MSDQNQEDAEERIDEVYRQLHKDDAEFKQAGKSSSGKGEFKTLPDGEYSGRVYIKANTVGSQSSPNYGRKKYQFEFTVTAGEHKGRMAYYHHVIVEHELSIPPPKSDAVNSARWTAAVGISIRAANARLAACGVDCSDINQNLIIQRIAANNRRRTVVNFTMKDGTPFVNYIESERVEDRTDSLLHAVGLPDGNDAPLV